MTSRETKRKPVEILETDLLENKFLVLHNDDVHTFDYVADALVEICEHSYEQATQCTLITHYKGKCEVKKGVFRSLKPLKEALLKKELNATIE